MSDRPVVFLSAGEKSGDKMGGALAEDLKRDCPDMRLFGVGGEAMAAAGVELIADYRPLAVMGYWDALRALPSILALRRRVLNFLDRRRPDLFVGIDAPDFNLSLAGRLRAAGVRTAQYVAPSVWMWRARRLATISRRVNAVWCLLPFEKAVYEAAAIPAFFVGHVAARRKQPERMAARQRLGMGESEQVIALLPGSRRAELERHLPLVQGAMRRLVAPGRRFVAACANEEDALFLRRHCPDVALGEADEVLAAADIGLVKSGTITLEAMVAGLPMVTFYAVSPLAAWACRWRRFSLPFFSLPNILAGRFLVPELLLDEANEVDLADEAEALLADGERRRGMLAAFAGLTDSLRRAEMTPAEAARRMLAC